MCGTVPASKVLRYQFQIECKQSRSSTSLVAKGNGRRGRGHIGVGAIRWGFFSTPPSADSIGNINLIEAAEKAGVKKFVLVTSIGCGDSRDAPPAQVFDVLRPVLVEKDKAEARLREAAGMAHVIIRPGGLTNEPASGGAALTADPTVCGAVSREDAATLVAKAALSGAAENVTLSLVDRSQLFARGGADPEFEDFKL